MPKKSKVVVVIPSYNSRRYWDDLMPALVKEQSNDFEIEILVVDNNSSDDSVSYLQANFPAVKVIANRQNLGFVGANNQGYEYAKQAKADYLYLLNQDTVITAGWLQPLFDFAQQRPFGSLQSKILLWPKTDLPKINSTGNVIHFLGFGYTENNGQPDRGDQEIKKINYASGTGVFISLAVLDELGYLFDDSMFMYLEDLDLGWSLKLLGYENYLIPESVIYHKYEHQRSMKQVYWFERNRLWVMLKNYQWLTLILLFPAWLLMEIGQLLFAAVHRYFFKKIQAYGFLFSASQWKILLAKRRVIQTKRRLTDRQATGNFSGKILFQPLESGLLSVANFFFNLYWQIIKQIIFW